MISGIGDISGIKIIFSEHCADIKYELYERCWRERLFSWPWRPWARRGVKEIVNPLIYKITPPVGFQGEFGMSVLPSISEQFVLAHTSLKPEIEEMIRKQECGEGKRQ